MQHQLKIIGPIDQTLKTENLPLLASKIAAGFPSPAEDYIEEGLDLNSYLVKKKASTFIVKVIGDSMKDAHIFSGDLLIVDRAKKARSGSIIVALLNGEFTVKRLKKAGGKIFLVPENSRYQPIEVKEGEETDFSIWGVVTFVIHQADQDVCPS